jgi:hypothetical protein
MYSLYELTDTRVGNGEDFVYICKCWSLKRHLLNLRTVKFPNARHRPREVEEAFFTLLNKLESGYHTQYSD